MGSPHLDLKALSIPVRREDVLDHIGYKRLPEKNLLHLIDEMVDLGNRHVKPVMGFQEVAESGDLPLFLQGAKLRYIALATIGPSLEELVKELFDSEKATEGYLLDTVGSAAVMHVGNALWAEMNREAAVRGFKKGLRRAPGCEGVPMEVQRWIVETFHDPHPDIRATPSCMLVPRKSFAFLGRFGGKVEGVFSCKGCPQFLKCDLRS